MANNTADGRSSGTGARVSGEEAGDLVHALGGGLRSSALSTTFAQGSAAGATTPRHVPPSRRRDAALFADRTRPTRRPARVRPPSSSIGGEIAPEAIARRPLARHELDAPRRGFRRQRRAIPPAWLPARPRCSRMRSARPAPRSFAALMPESDRPPSPALWQPPSPSAQKSRSAPQQRVFRPARHDASPPYAAGSGRLL